MISLHAGSALTAAFLASLVEAAEAMTIVLAVAVVRGWWRVSKSFSFWLRSDAGHDVLLPVSAAAFAACLLVASSGIFLHRPLARVPENALKFAVGVMLSAFGLFWTGEGFGVDWPGADLAILAFIALFLGTGLALVTLLSRRSAAAGAP